MVRRLELILSIQGKSGTEYDFDLYSFDDFDELEDYFSPIGAVYVFVHADCFTKNCMCQYVYCGKTGKGNGNLSNRFDYHHAERCIRGEQANCIGIYSEENEQRRSDIETDILEGNNFPCNKQHQ